MSSAATAAAPSTSASSSPSGAAAPRSSNREANNNANNNTNTTTNSSGGGHSINAYFPGILGGDDAKGEADCKYIRIRPLGAGSFAEAWEVRRKSDGQVFAAKIMYLKTMDARAQRRAKSEVQCLQSCSHFACLSFVEHYESDNRILIIVEYCNAGDLAGYIRACRESNQPFPEATIAIIILQLILALEHMHRRRIIHRDIKSQNVFLSTTGLVKVGDFGLSNEYETISGDVANTFCGTPYYLAPEVWRRQRYGARADIWALGVLSYELITGRCPFTSNDMTGLAKRVEDPHHPINAAKYRVSQELVDLVDVMLTKDPAKRPRAIHLLMYTPYLQRQIQQFVPTVNNTDRVSSEMKASIATCMADVESAIVAQRAKDVIEEERYRRMAEAAQQQQQQQMNGYSPNGTVGGGRIPQQQQQQFCANTSHPKYPTYPNYPTPSATPLSPSPQQQQLQSRGVAGGGQQQQHPTRFPEQYAQHNHPSSGNNNNITNNTNNMSTPVGGASPVAPQQTSASPNGNAAAPPSNKQQLQPSTVLQPQARAPAAPISNANANNTTVSLLSHEGPVKKRKDKGFVSRYLVLGGGTLEVLEDSTKPRQRRPLPLTSIRGVDYTDRYSSQMPDLRVHISKGVVSLATHPHLFDCFLIETLEGHQYVFAAEDRETWVRALNDALGASDMQ